MKKVMKTKAKDEELALSVKGEGVVGVRGRMLSRFARIVSPIFTKIYVMTN